MKYDIVFSVLALREVAFFSRVAHFLEQAGYRTAFITFHEAGARVLTAEGWPCFSMQKLAREQVGTAASEGLAEQLARRYGISLVRTLLVHDRLTLNRPDEAQLLEKAARYFAVLESVLAEHDIGCIVQELGGFIANQTVYYSSRRAGVRHVFIEPSMYAGRVLFSDALLAGIAGAGLVPDTARKASQEAVTSYLTSKAVNIPRKDAHHFSDMSLSRLIAADNWRRVGRKLYYKYITREQEEYDAIANAVMWNIKRFLRRQVLGGAYRQPIAGEKYVYYPLHVPHDVQLFVRSPEYVSQEALVEYIGRCLPYGYTLYVKEHPAAIGAHSLGATRAFLRARNTKLIHPRVNSYALIENAACVVTVNSKVGVEALMQNKPVVVLGKAFYRGQGITHDVDSLGCLSEVICQAIGQPPNPSQVGDFLARVYAATYPGELYVSSEEREREFAASLMEFIQTGREASPLTGERALR